MLADDVAAKNESLHFLWNLNFATFGDAPQLEESRAAAFPGLSGRQSSGMVGGMRRVLMILHLLSICLLATVSSAQQEAADLTPEEVTAAQAAMEADAGIDDSVKGQLKARYDKALQALQSATQYQEQAATYEDSLETAPEATKEKQATLDSLPEAKPIPLPDESASFEEVQAEVEAQQTKLHKMRARLGELSDLLGTMHSRPVAISERLPANQAQLKQVTERLAAPELVGENLSPGRKAERLELQARKLMLEQEREMLSLEQRSQAEREALIRTERSLTEQQLEQAQADFQRLQSFQQEFLSNETARVTQLAEEIAREAASGDEWQVELAKEVQKLVEEFNSAVKLTETYSLLENRLQMQSSKLIQEFELIRDQLAFGRPDETLAPLIFEFSRELRVNRKTVERATEATEMLNTARLNALEIERKLRHQTELETRVASANQPELEEILKLRRDILEKSRTQYRALIRELAQLVTDANKLLEEMETIRKFLRQQLFLARTSPLINAGTFTRLPASVRWFFSQEHVDSVFLAFKSSATARPLGTSLIWSLIVALLIARPWIGRRLRSATQKTHRTSKDHYNLTLLALLYTVLLTLPVVLISSYVVWVFRWIPAPNDWFWGVRQALPLTAWVFILASFLMAVCRDDGLAAHFRWDEEAYRVSRRVFMMFAVVYGPVLLVVGGCFLGGNSFYLESLGRITFIISQLWIAYLIWRLFKFSNGVFSNVAQDNPQRAVVKWRWVWLPLTIALPVALVVMAVLGYLVGAIDLSMVLLTTMALVAFGAFTYWLVLRWFMIRERRLALEVALTKRRKAREEAEDSEPEEEAADEVVLVDKAEEEINLVSVGSQTRRLLRSLFSVAILMLVLWFLSLRVPAIDAIDDWQVIGTLSLLELIQLVVAIVVTIAATRNLPGVLELGVLGPMNVSSGTRHAIQRIVQYLLVTAGILIMFNILQIDWAQFGWIAAALSVGIGFGLQEVVANFVCGLILLFERPIRIGDIITIDGTTGTVTKFQMRATTIMNWDRQELVVPNKTFITGTLLNWTLSNAVNRLSIPVGVAYGSNTSRALVLLQEIASAHPLVLEDPAPLTSFEELSDSTLNLVLRVYLPDMDNRLKVLTEIHSEICRRFAEESITIAFPQRDLNLGQGWEKLAQLSSPSRQIGSGE